MALLKESWDDSAVSWSHKSLAVRVLLCPDSKGREGSGYPLPTVWGALLYITALAVWVGRRKALLLDRHPRQEQVIAQPFSATPSKKALPSNSCCFSG